MNKYRLVKHPPPGARSESSQYIIHGPAHQGKRDPFLFQAQVQGMCMVSQGIIDKGFIRGEQRQVPVDRGGFGAPQGLVGEQGGLIHEKRAGFGKIMPDHVDHGKPVGVQIPPVPDRFVRQPPGFGQNRQAVAPAEDHQSVGKGRK